MATKRKVYTFFNIDKAQKWVGKEGVFSDIFAEVSMGCGHVGILKKFKEDPLDAFQFRSSDGVRYQFFTPNT